LYIDHINQIKHDNRISNLRAVTHAKNKQNLSISPRNKTGVTGVSWCRNTKSYQVQLQHNSVKYKLGYFKNFDDAVAARRAKEEELGFHPNHGSKKHGLKPRLDRTTTSGVLGINWETRRNMWIVRLRVEGKMKYIGCSADKEEAIKMLAEAKIKYSIPV